MAVNLAPTEIFANYTDDGSNMTIPHADIEGFVDADADAATGDWRAIYLALLNQLATHWANLPDADKPSAFVVSNPSQSLQTSGDFDGKWKITYGFSVYADLPLPSIADEPA